MEENALKNQDEHFDVLKSFKFWSSMFDLEIDASFDKLKTSKIL